MVKRTGGTPGAPQASIAEAIAAITALLGGGRTDLSGIDCDFSAVSPFDAGVLRAARAVPAGQTTTYGALATTLGDPALARRVGQALGRNPLPIIVPCHRIMGADGRLVGFSARGGVALKLQMLTIEGAPVGGGAGLFDDLPLALKPRP